MKFIEVSKVINRISYSKQGIIPVSHGSYFTSHIGSDFFIYFFEKDTPAVRSSKNVCEKVSPKMYDIF